MRFSNVTVAVAATALLTAASGVALAGDADEVAVEAAKKYAGTELTLFLEAGLSELGFELSATKRWEELTGIKVNMNGAPTNEMYAKIVIEHEGRTGAFDIVDVQPQWMPDLVEIGALEPLDDFIEQFGYADEIMDIAPFYREAWNKYKGTTYAFADDGDVLLLYYRKDLFEDADNKKMFKAEYGYDLAPPADWGQFDEIAKFFTDNFAPDLYGASLVRSRGLTLFFWSQQFRAAGGRFFDEDTMKATVNSDIGVASLQALVDRTNHMPPGNATWGFVEKLSAWLAGQVAMTVSWPAIGRWSEGLGTDIDAMSWIPKTTVANKVGYAIVGKNPGIAPGFALAVSSGSKNKEAAYLFIQWANSADVSVTRSELPYSIRDPFRLSHYASPLLREQWPNAASFQDTLREGGELGMMDLTLRNTAAYQDAMSTAIQAAIGGKDPREALDQLAKDWDELTEQTGVDRQRDAYKAFVAGRGYPPES